jgi:hypothetical protein
MMDAFIIGLLLVAVLGFIFWALVEPEEKP